MILALAPVVFTFLVQWMMWPFIRPYAWFLFTPAVFLSAWIGGRRLGILATIVATLLVSYFFLPPERTFEFKRTVGELGSALTFLGTGILFSLFHDRLKRAERRAAEAVAATRYQAQLESVFQSIQDGIVVFDMTGTVILVNEAWGRIHGLSSTDVMERDLTFFQGLYEVNYPDGKPLPFEEWPIHKVLKGESITNLELHARRRDTGQEWFFSFSGEPVRDEQGKQVIAVVGTRDITERKQSEASLRATENRFRAIFENAAVGITRVAPDGRFLEVNQRLCEMLGYTREELMKKTFMEITHRDYREADLNESRRMLAGETEIYRREKRYLRKDCSVLWAGLAVSLVRHIDGSPDYFVTVIEDISAHKRAEDKLVQSEQRLRLALRAAGLGVFEWNIPADRAVWENERMYELFGHTNADGTLSKARLTADYIYPDDVASFEAALTNGMKSGRPVHTIYRIRRKDGAMRWLDLSSSFEPAHDGLPLRMIGVLADITERQLAEEKLRASEKQFRILADTAPVLIWASGTDGFCTFFNKPWLQFTGRTMEQELGNGWTAGVHPEDYDRCLETYVTSFDARQPFEMEYRLRRYDGEYRWIVDHGVPRFSSKGNFLGYIGSCIDIHEHKEIERALRASELRFRTMVSAIPSPTYEGDSDGNNTFVSDQWCTYTGMTAAESAGRGFAMAFHPDDAEDAKARYRVAVQSGKLFESRLRIRAADGSYHWFLNRALPGRDAEGRIARWAGSLTDIDDLLRAQEALRELTREQTARAEAERAAERIRRLQAVIDSALAHLTLDDLFHEMLARIRELLETDSAAILLLTEDKRSLVVRAAIGFEEDAIGFHVPVGKGVSGSIAASLSPLIVEDLSAVDVISPVLRQNARSLIGAPLIVKGQCMGVIHADTSQFRRFTESDVRLLQLAADRIALATHLRQLYKVEQQARRQAEEANRIKDEFLAVVSHELRSPLTAILGYTHILRLGPSDRNTIDHAAAVVERSAKAQLQIIEDLLDSARIITGKLRIDQQPVDLVPVLEAALDTVRAAAEAKGVTLDANFGSAPEETLGDSTRLQQVVWNLVSNAVKFTPKGGRVELRMEGSADNVFIEVNDTGKGIEPEFLPFVFDRFRQADSSSSRRFGGLGLGLSLVKHLVELHGGTIVAASEGVGRGSTFTVTLPRRPLEGVGAPAPKVVPHEVRTDDALHKPPLLEGVSVLVVDDQEDARVLLTHVLAEYGAKATAFSSGQEALAFLSNPPEGRRPDIIILDIAMPDEDGYSVLKQVRALETEQGFEADRIPAIALTAIGRTEDRLRALQAGFHMHVTKPVEPAELALTIASLINRSIWERRREVS